MEINRIEVISAVVSEMIASLPEERRQKALSSAAPQSVVRLFAAQLSFVAVLIDKVRIIKL